MTATAATSPTAVEAAAAVSTPALPEGLEVLAELAALDDPLAAAVAELARRLQPALSERIATWEPQLKQRNLTTADWKRFAPLVRAAVVCANPSSTEVAGDLLTDALSLTRHAAERRMPLRLGYVFRETTAKAYLNTVNEASRATVASRMQALVAGISTAPERTRLDSAGAVTATALVDGSDQDGAAESSSAAEVEPLLLDRPVPNRRQLAAIGLNTAAASEALAVLALVREQVKVVEPNALRREERFRGRGRSVPYGDVEVVALLAAAATQRSTKARLHSAACIAVGIGAGVTGEDAAHLKGGDILTHDHNVGGPAVRVRGRLVPLHVAFAAPALAAARHAGTEGWLLGGGRDRKNRISGLAGNLANTDPHLVRLSSTRLAATWLTLHLTRGVPLGDLIAVAGWTSVQPLDRVLPYLPRATPAGLHALTGHPAASDPAAVAPREDAS